MTSEEGTQTDEIAPTERTALERRPQRGSYDRATVYRILDEGLIAHVGFTVDAQPFVIPTAYGRIDDRLYFHGSAASRMLRAMAWETEICVTVTLLDGLVLARSAFHHSMNYRSVCVFGAATLVADAAEKFAALHAITDHIVPGRWAQSREPNQKETNATMVLSLPITEASAKIRSGDPIDDAADYQLDYWAGVIPLELTAKAPIRDSKLQPEIETPFNVLNYKRRASNDEDD